MDKNNLPIVIHHEGMPWYLAVCIKQALKYNKCVYLIGDSSNKRLESKYNIKWIDGASLNKSWDVFVPYFKNYSDYPESYARQILMRLFALNDFFEFIKYDKCILIDSDVMLYTNFDDLYDEYSQYEASLCVPQYQDNFRWTAKTGCSYWTKKGIENFISFCTDTYKNHIDVLLNKFNYHKKNGISGGICEMTILYLWYKNNSDSILNDAKPVLGGVIDSGIGSSENYYKDEYCFDPKLQMKKITWEKDGPYFITQNSERRRAYSMHFGGRSDIKEYIWFAQHNRIPQVSRPLVNIFRKSTTAYGKIKSCIMRR